MLTKFTLAVMMIAPLLAPSLADAGQSGYIRHGQTYIVYKDGKKVGDWPTDEKADAKPTTKTAAKDAQAGREPASTQITNDTLFFVDDNPVGTTSAFVRCYAISNAIGFAKSEPISCQKIN